MADLVMVSVLGDLRGCRNAGRLPRLAAYVARGEDRPAHRRAMEDCMAAFDRGDSAQTCGRAARLEHDGSENHE